MESYEELAQVAKHYSRAIAAAGKWQARANELRTQMDDLSAQIVREQFPGEGTEVIANPETATETEQE